MITRTEHMKDRWHNGDKEKQMKTHRAYYAQLVTPDTVFRVVTRIGADRIAESAGEHMNDIPLSAWDDVARGLPVAAGGFERLGDYATLAGLVCVAKEAARQWKESQA